MNPINILIVEDESIIAMEIKERLNEMGYQVPQIIPSGEEAITMALEIKPDLILMDIMLKMEINGVEAAEIIKEKLDIPIVFLTANTDNHTFQEAVMAEPYGYLTKPFSEILLHNTIEMALYKHTMDKRAKENEKWLSTLIQSIGEGIIATDNNGKVTLINPVAEEYTGWFQNEAKGNDIEKILILRDEKTGEKMENPLRRALNTGAMIHKEENLILISKDGRELPIDENAAPILNNQGNILGAIAMIRDVTSQRETQAKIQFMANHDELTKLPNRYFLNTRLETAIADANITGNKIALMYLDLDGFKQVNDRFGHNIGDKILQQVTTRLEESIRGSDIVARLGGDEFLFLLDNLKATSDSTLVAKKVLEKFKNPFKVDDQSVTISASIGISIFPDDSDNPVELLVLADRAMYAAKNDGKNMFKHYRPTMIIDGKIKK